MDKRMMLKLNGGRTVIGILRGFDPFMNVVIDETVEECRDGTRNNIGMVVSWPDDAGDIDFMRCLIIQLTVQFGPLQVIRGNSIVLVEGLERL